MNVDFVRNRKTGKTILGSCDCDTYQEAAVAFLYAARNGPGGFPERALNLVFDTDRKIETDQDFLKFIEEVQGKEPRKNERKLSRFTYSRAKDGSLEFVWKCQSRPPANEGEDLSTQAVSTTIILHKNPPGLSIAGSNPTSIEERMEAAQGKKGVRFASRRARGLDWPQP